MKKLLYVVGALILIYMGLCLAGPSSVQVNRKLEMNHAAPVIFEQLNAFKNWENWSPWFGLDSNAVYTYEGVAGVGSKAAWRSEDPMVGVGKQEIIESMEFSHVAIELSFEGQGDAQAFFNLHETGPSNTMVEWGFVMVPDFFQRGIMLFLDFEDILGPTYEKGLAQLNTYLEGSEVGIPVGGDSVSSVSDEVDSTQEGEQGSDIAGPGDTQTIKETVEEEKVPNANASLDFINTHQGTLIAKPENPDLMNRAFDDVSLTKQNGGNCTDRNMGNEVLLMNNNAKQAILVKVSLVWKNTEGEKQNVFKQYTVKPSSIMEIGCSFISDQSKKKVKWSIVHTQYAD
jgi:hypothetical protein